MLVRGDRIVEIGPVARVKVPDGGVRVEGRGKFLIPGLAEMHAHIPGGQASDTVVERTLYLYVAGGITTVRGMLGHPRHLELRARAARDELREPDDLHLRARRSTATASPTPEAAAKAVTEQKAAGYDLLKIHPGVSREAFDTLAATARAGRASRSRATCPRRSGSHRAIEARYASIDHLDGYLEGDAPRGRAGDRRAVGVLRAQPRRAAGRVEARRRWSRRPSAPGVWNVPTQVLMENLIVGGHQRRSWPRAAGDALRPAGRTWRSGRK